MNFTLSRKRVLRLALLLWALPSTVYAFDDSIIYQALWGLLAVVAGMVVVFWGLGKLLVMLTETLGKGEAAATDEGVAFPVRTGKVQRGLAVRVMLLTFPLQLLWLWTAIPAASIARLVVPHGYYIKATPTASVAHLMVPHGYWIYVLITCALTSIPTIMLVVWLWHTRRPSMALGIALSGGLAIGGLGVLMMVQHEQPTGAEAVVLTVAGLNQLAGALETRQQNLAIFVSPE